MQPTCKQVPPRKPSFSMTRVFRPHCEARMAVTYPPGPLPMMARSYAGKGNLRRFVATVLVPTSHSRRVQDQTGEGRARARGHAGRNTPEYQTKLNSSNGPRGSQPARAAVGLVLQELGRRTVVPAKKLRTQESERRRLNLSNGCAKRRGGFLDTRKGGT